MKKVVIFFLFLKVIQISVVRRGTLQENTWNSHIVSLLNKKAEICMAIDILEFVRIHGYKHLTLMTVTIIDRDNQPILLEIKMTH